jgi:hypothetical protein
MYTVDNPPKNWAQYPKSFLNEAIPVLTAFKDNFALSWKHLGEQGLTQKLKAGACPVIKKLDAIKKSEKTEISYEIDGSESEDYFISLSLYSGKKFIRTLMMGTGQLKSVLDVATDEELTEIRLNVRLSGFNDVSDSKVVVLEATQPSLL